MPKQSSVNLDITNNPNGFDITGGTTPRTLSLTGGNVTITGTGAAEYIFPSVSTTLVGVHNTVAAINGRTGGITFAAGTGITFTFVNGVLTISTTA